MSLETRSPAVEKKLPSSNYAKYIEADFNRPSHYPLEAHPNLELYAPIGEWVGRLILPAAHERESTMGTFFEVHLAPPEHANLIGQVIRLRWSDDARTNAHFWSQSRPVAFTPNSEKMVADGLILPERVNRWDLVNPFESLAGSHPQDDIVVRLTGPVELESGVDERPIIRTPGEPVQVTGRYYALVQFLSVDPADADQYTVVHFNRVSRDFDGPREVVRVPTVEANLYGARPSSNVRLETSPANQHGWYAYGAVDADGMFVVRSLAPRALLRLSHESLRLAGEDVKHYLSPKAWKEAAHTCKGEFTRAEIAPDGPAVSWSEGEEALLIHLYGRIGGNVAEPTAKIPFYWGHFAFGSARVTREPLADELIFDIVYRQIYTQNTDGVTAGALHWSRYSGDRQFGWLGIRPIQDILLKLDCFTGRFEADPRKRSALTAVVDALEVMAARYRIADGRGGVSVSAAYNCAQDANQALYSAVRWLMAALRERADEERLRLQYPEDARRREQLLELAEDIQHTLLPFGADRADWQYGAETLSSGASRSQLKNLSMALRTWRTVIPPVAARALVRVFLKHGAAAFVLRTFQVGGQDPDIEPYVPSW